MSRRVKSWRVVMAGILPQRRPGVRALRGSAQEVEGADLAAEAQRVVDDAGQELVQALVEDRVDAAVAQARVDLAGAPVALAAAPAERLGEVVEGRDDLPVAADERARHLRAEDQELGDPPGRERLVVDPLVGAPRRDRAEDRLPLPVVER